MKAISLAVVTVNWNQPQLTSATLASLAQAQLPSKTSVVIVDNGSSPPYRLPTKSYPFKTFLIKSSENLGFARGFNLGISKAVQDLSGDFLLLVNNDVIFSRNFLPPLIQALEREPNSLVSPVIYFAPGFEYHRQRYSPQDKGRVVWYAGGLIDWKNCYCSHYLVDQVAPVLPKKSYPTAFASGCCLFAPRLLFQKIGFFNPDYFLYWEDVDFSHRAKLAGFTPMVVPLSTIWHKNAGSSSVGGALHDYFLTRNRLIFGFRYAPWKTKIVLFKQSLTGYRQSSTWQKKAVSDYYLHRWGRGSWPKKT